ncbi:MAG: FlgD immunoglobulin-like domain containing protein [Candidatus Cloacimonetes bacterium]|nr:FlgD immunoglobulin-like domain containing protein [Candidatus Cloacimonadota bacterium]
MSPPPQKAARKLNAFFYRGYNLRPLLLLLVLILLSSGLSGLTTLNVLVGSTNFDLQTIINYALQDLGTETEAEIILQCSEISIQPGLPSYTSLTINIGASSLSKLSIIGLSAENHSLLTLTQHTAGITPTSIFTVKGNYAENKEVAFKYLNLQYSGTYVDRHGIKVENGLNMVKVENCKFSQLGYGISEDTTFPSSSMVRNTILDANEFYEPSGVGTGMNFTPFHLFKYGSYSNSPIDANITITNNVISGLPKYWGDISIYGDDNIDLNISDNHFIDSSANSSSAYLSLSSSDTGSVNLLMQRNEFINGRVLIQGLSGSIVNNKFFTEINRSLEWQLFLFPVSTTDHISVNSNMFSGASQSAIDMSSQGDDGTLSVAIEQNSFTNYGSALRIHTSQNYTSGTEIISSFKNNLIACNSTPFSVLDGLGPITLSPQVVVTYCFFLNSIPSHDSFQIDLLTCKAGDPGIALDSLNHSYTLNWNENERSPLIMGGTLEGYSIFGIESRRDIGAIQYDEHPHEYMAYTFPAGNDRNGIKWMSFPSLDRIYGDEDMAFTFLEQLSNAFTLSAIHWKELNYAVQDLYVSGGTWYGLNHAIQPQVGYKVEMNPSLQNPITISTPAIKPDPELPITLKAWTNQRSAIPDNENWLGYFGEQTVHPYEAFESILDNLWYIQSQNWTLARKRVSPSSPWIGLAYPGSKPPTLQYGDMVIVKCFEDADFTWNTEAPELEPFVKEKATKFTFIEKMDYVPVYVEFTGTDIPKEAAVFLEGVCKGAAVVGGSSVEIPAYVLDDLAYGAELELRVFYDTKAAYNPIPRYQTWNIETEQYENNALTLTERQPYYMMKMDAGSLNDTPAPKLYMANYPNPFNPDTTLRFSLPEDAEVILDIYNLKGQKVRKLLSGSQTAGMHTCLWDAKDNSGNKVSSGIYFAVLSTHGNQLSRKMLLMK